jgi:hypothetical protein
MLYVRLTWKWLRPLKNSDCSNVTKFPSVHCGLLMGDFRTSGTSPETGTHYVVLKNVKIFVFSWEVFWVVTPCSVVAGYQRFRGPCCLRLHSADGGSKVLRKLVSYHNTTLHGVTTHKTWTWIFTAAKAWKLHFHLSPNADIAKEIGEFHS